MSNRTIQVDDRLYDYLASVSLRENSILRQLRDETAAMGGVARMQISPEQGQFMALLVELTGAQRLLEMGTFTGYSSTIGEKDSTLTLSKAADKNWKASFSYARPAPDQLVLNGSMDGHQVQMKLRLLDRNKFTLVNRGFHWINEYPFQR